MEKATNTVLKSTCFVKHFSKCIPLSESLISLSVGESGSLIAQMLDPLGKSPFSDQTCLTHGYVRSVSILSKGEKRKRKNGMAWILERFVAPISCHILGSGLDQFKSFQIRTQLELF